MRDVLHYQCGSSNIIELIIYKITWKENVWDLNSEEKHSRMVCNSCRRTFRYQDAATIKKTIYGIEIPEKRCPICGGSFRAIEIPDELDSYLYVNSDERYYSYKDKSRN